MARVARAVCAVQGPQGRGRLLLGRERVGGSDQSSPLLDRPVSNELHGDDSATGHEVSEACEEWLAPAAGLSQRGRSWWEPGGDEG